MDHIPEPIDEFDCLVARIRWKPAVAAYILPLLPTVRWNESWTPPDLVVATPTYFLPKSIEILFQQLLIVALVLALAARRQNIRFDSTRAKRTRIFLCPSLDLLRAFGGFTASVSDLGQMIRRAHRDAAIGTSLQDYERNVTSPMM